MSETVHETPGALEQEFTPDVEQPHAQAPEPAADVRLGGWTREGILWTIEDLSTLDWSRFDFDPTHEETDHALKVLARLAAISSIPSTIAPHGASITKERA